MNLKNPKFFLKFFLLIFSGAASATMWAPRQESNFNISILLPLSGANKDEAKIYEEGFKMAEAELKARKIPITLKFIDTKSLTEESARLYIEESRKGTPLIISPFGGWAITKIIDLSQSLKQPTLSLYNFPLAVQKKSPYLLHFSTYPDRYPQAMAIYAKESLKAEAVSIVWEEGNEGSWRNAQSFKEAWLKLGAKKFSEMAINFNPLNNQSLLEKLKNEKIKYIYFSNNAARSAELIKSINDTGAQITFLGDPSWNSELFFKAPSDSLAGNFFPTDYFVEDSSRFNLDTLKKNSKFLNKKTLNANMAIAYDSILWIQNAILQDKTNWWSILQNAKDIPCLSNCEKFNEHTFMERKITILSTQKQRARFKTKL